MVNTLKIFLYHPRLRFGNSIYIILRSHTLSARALLPWHRLPPNSRDLTQNTTPTTERERHQIEALMS